MESVDALREYIGSNVGLSATNYKVVHKLFHDIEEEFKEQEQAHNFAYSQVYDFASGIYGQLLDFEKMDEQQEAMAEHGWVKLPVDADGEVVRIGDVMVMASHPFGCEDKPLVVDRMELSRGMHGEVWCLALDTDRSCWTQAAVLRHYHAPTVEDVLREFGKGWHERMVGPETFDIADYVEQYAAKLRLAGDE